MALRLLIEREDGTEDEIPMLVNDSAQLGAHVASARIERTYIHSRSQLEERRYRSRDLERVIQKLRGGDRIKVTTEPTSYADQVLTIERGGDEALGVNDDGEEFHVIPVFWGSQGQGDGQPWLRTGEWDSRGMIEEIEVISLGDGT